MYLEEVTKMCPSDEDRQKAKSEIEHIKTGWHYLARNPAVPEYLRNIIGMRVDWLLAEIEGIVKESR